MLFNIKQAAEMLGISRAMLYRVISSGEITYVKIGRRTLFREADLENYIVRNLQQR